MLIRHELTITKMICSQKRHLHFQYPYCKGFYRFLSIAEVHAILPIVNFISHAQRKIKNPLSTK